MVSSALAHVDHPKSIMEVDEPEDNENVDLGGKSLDQLEDDVSDAELASILKRIGLLVNPSDLKTMSPRHIEYLHLIETERNYVTILMNIIKVNLFNYHCVFIRMFDVFLTKINVFQYFFFRFLKNRVSKKTKRLEDC